MEEPQLRTDPILLMELAKRGDTDAFGRLYELYFTPIFRYAYFRVRSIHAAEDITQEVFLKAYRSIENFEDKNKPPLAYFFTIARNTVIDYWRKKKDVLFGEDEAWERIPDENSDPMETADRKGIANSIRRNITTLTQEQQEVIVLKFINEMSYREIAEMLDKSEDAVRQLQCRALRALRKELKDKRIL